MAKVDADGLLLGKAFYSPQELARILSVHPHTIRRHIESGIITGTRVGTLIRIPVAEVRRVVRGGTDDA